MKLTKKKALKLLAEAVEEKGGSRVVLHCTYFLNGEPNCMVGVVLDKMGVPADKLDRYGSTGFAYLIKPSDNALAHTDGEYTFTPKAVEVLSEAQKLQDAAEPWGDVLDRVNEKFA